MTYKTAIEALIRLEKKLERVDGLFKHSPERDDIKVVLDYILQTKDNQ